MSAPLRCARLAHPAILHAARAKFPGHDWASVEDHIRKAWNAMAHEAPWEEVSDPARQAWEAKLE